MASREMWRPAAEVRAEQAVADVRARKVRDMVARIQMAYRTLGVDDPTRSMVAMGLNERTPTLATAWDTVAELTGHRPPSELTKSLVLEHFPEA